jgi:hypothetical protein
MILMRNNVDIATHSALWVGFETDTAKAIPQLKSAHTDFLLETKNVFNPTAVVANVV